MSNNVVENKIVVVSNFREACRTFVTSLNNLPFNRAELVDVEATISMVQDAINGKVQLARVNDKLNGWLRDED